VWRDGFRRSDLIPRHTNRCIMASHHCQKKCHRRRKGFADIDCLASLGSDTSKVHSRLRRYVQDYTISRFGGAASSKLTRRRRKLNAIRRSLSISRPDMQDEICVAGYMHDSLMITKTKVTANDMLARSLIPVSLSHSSTPAAGLP
jgi:hypothetical protein